MAKLKAAMIGTGFIPRDIEDPFDLLKKFADIGYKGFEVPDMAARNMMGASLDELKEAVKKLRDLGLEPLSTIAFANPSVDTDTLIKNIAEKTLAYGLTRTTFMVSEVAQYRFGQYEEPLTYDAAMKNVELMETVAAALKKEGIVTCFHNHDEEFLTCYKGVPFYYLMAANTDDLKFELDCGWATYAGFNPVQVMKQLGDRLCAVHIKDFAEGGVEQERKTRTIVMPRFTTPGTGKLDLKGCLQQALDMGIDYAIIEQDFMYNLDPLATVTAAYYNMKETGLVE